MLPGVSIVSLCITLLNSLPFFINVFREKEGFTYLAVSHYWQDYFFYVNHFFQGAHGGVLTKNQFTGEMTDPSILYWPNILMGKIGSLFTLSPVYSYNIAIILLTFSIPLLLYAIGKKLYIRKWHQCILFIFTFFSTGFFDVSGMRPFDLWRTPHLMFYRFGGIPHHLLQTLCVFILFYLEIIFLKNCKFRNTLMEMIVIIILSSINPIMAGVYVGGLSLGYIPTMLTFISKKNYRMVKKYFFHLCAFVFSFAVTTLYMHTLLSVPPHPIFAAWETEQQIKTTIEHLFLAMGPIVILFLIGIIPAIRKKHILWFSSVTIPLLAYALFLSPIPKILGTTNTRALFPALYLFFGIVSVEALSMLHSLSWPWKPKLYKKLIIPVILFLFFLCSAPSIMWEIQGKVSSSHDTGLTTWLPTDIYRVYEKLSTITDFDAITIAGPTFGFDTLIPALSGHTTYSGHMLTTIDNAKKQEEVKNFFSLTVPTSAAFHWLREHQITYIIFTDSDGNRSAFESTYPFLEKLMETSASSLYRVSMTSI